VRKGNASRISNVGNNVSLVRVVGKDEVLLFRG
jgi:hypothetical protein